MTKLLHNNSGSMVVEVLIALGMIGVIVFSIGEVLAANNKLEQRGESNEVAVSLARQSLEIISGDSNDLFITQCHINNTCTGTDLKLDDTGGTWNLYNGVEDIELNNVTYTRSINIENIKRDQVTGLIDESSTYEDPNSKKIDVAVSWIENGINKTINLTTYITLWENMTS